MKLVFCLQINIKNFILGVARHAHIAQKNKFAICLQYLQKKVSDEADLLHAHRHESFLQIDTMIFDGDDQSFPKFPK